MPERNPELKFVVTDTLIVKDIQRSVAFYRDVLGAKVVREGQPTFLQLGNIWLTINIGGGPTDDKPEVVASPLRDPNVLSIFLNLRVNDIRRYYDLWSSRGAKFITEPKVHATELRCYMRDPDGYLIEVGQTTITPGPLDLYADCYAVTDSRALPLTSADQRRSAARESVPVPNAEPEAASWLPPILMPSDSACYNFGTHSAHDVEIIKVFGAQGYKALSEMEARRIEFSCGNIPFGTMAPRTSLAYPAKPVRQ